jgi:hypothetical protein
MAGAASDLPLSRKPAPNSYHRSKTQLANPAIIKIAPPQDIVFANGGNQKIPPPEARLDW